MGPTALRAYGVALGPGVWGETMVDVFISYAREDREQAQTLARLLKAKGLNVWWDWELVGGVDFRDKIHAALRAAKKVIVLWSEHSVPSTFVLDEAGMAQRAGKLVPILIDDSELPLGFGNLHTIKTSDPEDDIDQIIAAVKGEAAPPPRQSLFARLRKPLGKWTSTAVWLLTLAGSGATFVQALPNALQALSMRTGKPDNLAVFVGDDRPSATQYLKILAERGFNTEFVPLENASALTKAQARGLLFFHGNRERLPRSIKIEQSTIDLISERSKVVGIGHYGSLVLRAIDPHSMLHKVMHGGAATGVLDDKVKPDSIGKNLSTTSLLKLYEVDKVDTDQSVAAYDGGSTAMQQAKGISRSSDGRPPNPCQGSHWNVAVQGNLALWGFSLPATSLTKDGEQLFGDLAVYMRDTPYTDSAHSLLTTAPGLHSDQLGCGVPSRSYLFRPARPGPITASAHADKSVALILNAPYQVSYLARNDGPDVSVGFNVEPKHLEKPGLWRLSVTHFGEMRPETRIPVSLEFAYPYAPDRSLLWLFMAGLALVIGLIAALALLGQALGWRWRARA